MVKFLEVNDSIDLRQIEEIEDHFDFKFPDIYKQHLLKYNGGRCEPDVFTFVENGRVTASCIHWFLGIGGQYYDLKKDIKTFKVKSKRLPSHIFPIATDPLGNLICMSTGPNDYGYIYFWDHEKEVDYSIADDTDYSNLYVVASDLNSFFNDLQEDFNE